MQSFHLKQNKWLQKRCTICYEVWPTRVCTTVDSCEYMCTGCKRDKGSPKLFSKENKMHPGDVPECLKGLTQVEEMLIAKACPIMCIYKKHGGQNAYKGHVLNMPQDIEAFVNCLPHDVRTLPILHLRRTGQHNNHKDLFVRQQKVLSALQWLQCNNPFYTNITIDSDRLQQLPQDGIPTNLHTIDNSTEDNVYETGDDSMGDNYNSHSYLPVPRGTQTQYDAICSLFNNTGTEPLQWPNIANQPINEFNTPGLATQSFPTLFPFGNGDPTCLDRCRPVSLTESFKHLIRHADIVDGQFKWRFATHPRFPYWALNMKQRHQLLSQTSVYLHQHPSDAQLTIDDLRSMVGQLSAEQLMQRLQHYGAKVAGSRPYWYQRYGELTALIEQKGPPTFFWTVSSADNYWPDLHRLLPHAPGDQSDHSKRTQAVINNPHITDWYFTSKLKDWIQHWLYDTLGSEWHWSRCEYAGRGSTHAHGCAKLKNDPGICTLVQKAALAWDITQNLQSNDSDNAANTVLIE